MYARGLMGSFAPKHEHKELVVWNDFEECSGLIAFLLTLCIYAQLVIKRTKFQ